MWAVPDDEKDALRNFIAHLRASAGGEGPHNSIQGECGALITYLARVLPFLYRASIDSNLGELAELLAVQGEITELIRVLMETEDKARNNLNESHQEEIVQLRICLE